MVGSSGAVGLRRGDIGKASDRVGRADRGDCKAVLSYQDGMWYQSEVCRVGKLPDNGDDTLSRTNWMLLVGGRWWTSC